MGTERKVKLKLLDEEDKWKDKSIYCIYQNVKEKWKFIHSDCKKAKDKGYTSPVSVL